MPKFTNCEVIYLNATATDIENVGWYWRVNYTQSVLEPSAELEGPYATAWLAAGALANSLATTPIPQEDL